MLVKRQHTVGQIDERLNSKLENHLRQELGGARQFALYIYNPYDVCVWKRESELAIGLS